MHFSGLISIKSKSFFCVFCFIVEELECLGSWRETSQNYFVGKIHSKFTSSYEDSFRCFVYEQIFGSDGVLSGYKVAQSGDATCSGLTSASDGERTMRLIKGTHCRTKGKREATFWWSMKCLQCLQTSQSKRDANSPTGSLLICGIHWMARGGFKCKRATPVSL